jgi:hypothetical protein
MISFRIALTALILSCPLATEGLAQQQEKVELRFISFPPRQDWAEMEVLVGENKTTKIEVPSNELSKSYRIERKQPLLLGKTVDAAADENNFQVYARINLLAAPSQIILLKSKGHALSDGFEAIAIDASGTNFGGGKLLFINASSTGIAGIVGGEKFALRPNARKIVKPQANKGKDLCQVTFAYQKEQRWQTFSDTRWPVSDRHRGIIFFLEDPETRKLGLFAIRDSLKKHE